MAITRRKVTKEKEDLSVLESAKLNLSEEWGYKGDVITFEIETIPEKYDKQKNLVLIPENDDVIKINYEKSEIYINSDDLTDVEINLKDIPTSDTYDTVTVTASGAHPEKIKKLQEDVKPEEDKKEEVEKEEVKLEEVKNPVKVSKESKTKTTKKDGKKKMTKKKTVAKKFNEKSYTKEELINDLLINLENGNDYTKKELSAIINEIDTLREKALVQGKTLTMTKINFSRKLIKGRIHNAKMDTIKEASFVPPHVVMTAKVENEDKEVIKGEEIDKNTFKTKDGKEIKLDEVNKNYEAAFKKKYK
ncbi:hypothetical protein [Staphylococcus phage vB_StaM_SA1]|nr:hypothetical protein [Staphylococcus phage vB_StaM_SA1]